MSLGAFQSFLMNLARFRTESCGYTATRDFCLRMMPSGKNAEQNRLLNNQFLNNIQISLEKSLGIPSRRL
jgi:hypothetical protein